MGRGRAVLRESLAAIREKAMPDDWRRFNCMSLLGGAFLGRGQFTEAEPLLLEGYKGMKQREAKIPKVAKHRVAEAAERIAGSTKRPTGPSRPANGVRSNRPDTADEAAWFAMIDSRTEFSKERTSRTGAGSKLTELAVVRSGTWPAPGSRPRQTRRI